MKNKADVVIIGAGVHGLAAAFNLAKKGVKDIVVCEHKYIGYGATGRCAAGVREQFGLPLTIQLAKNSMDVTVNFKELYGYDIEYTPGGYLWLLYDEKDVDLWRNNIKLQNSLGVNSVLLDVDEIKEKYPYVNVKGVLAATMNPRDGYVNPFKVLYAYKEMCEKVGVEINSYTTVTGIRRENGKITGVETDKGNIQTDTVISCAGPYSRRVGKMVDLDLPVYPQRHEMLVTEPIKVFFPCMVITGPWYAFQTKPHGSVLMGITFPDEPLHDDVPSLQPASSWRFLEEALKVAVDIMPVLKDVSVVRQWGGYYDMTPDGQQIIGAVPEVPGFYLSCGWSGHGFQMGHITGRLLSELIVDGTTSIDISKSDLGRFARGELIPEPGIIG
ncbi:MAG: Sarcosine oxidase beta subunit [Firmicutes bacterium]|nr:Sarcosine oxidase beta subunit [Bacillota bacterium]MDI6707303.1 FAD-binding oxidoreductase [Bacillota bacterium]